VLRLATMNCLSFAAKVVGGCVNRVFKPRSERPPIREWIFGLGGFGAIYSTIVVENRDARFWVRVGAMALGLVQLFFWSSLAPRKRK
jgi:hypothetical protein